MFRCGSFRGLGFGLDGFHLLRLRDHLLTGVIGPVGGWSAFRGNVCDLGVIIGEHLTLGGNLRLYVRRQILEIVWHECDFITGLSGKCYSPTLQINAGIIKLFRRVPPKKSAGIPGAELVRKGATIAGSPSR